MAITAEALFPSLQQIIIVDTGALKAIFEDNDVLVVSSCGAHYCLSSPSSGSRVVRQLCEFSLSRNAAKLLMALDFRNLHYDTPVMTSSMRSRSTSNTFTVAYRIDTVCWPSTACDAQQSKCITPLNDGKSLLKSTDSFCSMVLHPNQRLAVCYPLLIHAQNGRYTYIWQNQLFSAMSYPRRWAPAVELLLQHAARPSAAADRAPSPAPEPARNNLTELPTAMPGAPAAAPAEDIADDSWWLQDTMSRMPASLNVAVMWLPSATLQHDLHTGAVHTWMHEDQSCISLPPHGNFLQQRLATGDDKCHAIDNLPDTLYVNGKRCSYDLRKVVLHARMIQRPPPTADPAIKASQTPASRTGELVVCNQGGARPPAGAEHSLHPQPSPDLIINQQLVDGLGEFKAYSDGSVRAFFLDRTILSMDAQQFSCKLFLPDGDALVVAVANPIGVQPYVQAAVEYARWVLQDPAQRAAERQLRAAVDLQLLRTQRMAAICGSSAGRC